MIKVASGLQFSFCVWKFNSDMNMSTGFRSARGDPRWFVSLRGVLVF